MSKPVAKAIIIVLALLNPATADPIRRCLCSHLQSSEPSMAASTADAASTGLEPLAGGWSSPACLKVIFRLSDIVIGTFKAQNLL